MHQALLIAQIILSVLLTVAILLQVQGSGLGASWSGGGETYHTRRGLEKILFYFTIGGVAAFILMSIGLFLV